MSYLETGSVIEAIKALNPDAEVSVINNDPDRITWHKGDVISKEEFLALEETTESTSLLNIEHASTEQMKEDVSWLGYKWDETKNAFYEPQPYSTWTLNETTFIWEPPVAFPSVLSYEKDGVTIDYDIEYDDTNTRWTASDQETPTGNFRWDPSSSSWVSI